MPFGGTIWLHCKTLTLVNSTSVWNRFEVSGSLVLKLYFYLKNCDLVRKISLNVFFGDTTKETLYEKLIREIYFHRFEPPFHKFTFLKAYRISRYFLMF